ncbi:hypothetical protein [Rhizobium leguminosarum]|uniref:hypothetical protein n=1 Tax=Rhizobium leguminosarum TaxID=384 RepID=UPI002E107058|nr:hypothetical protein U8Q02_39920 [Rhizobium leguminosarum]
MTAKVSGPFDDKYFGEMDAVIDAVLAPFQEWAETGFAEGALDLLPSRPVARPAVISARVLNDVWEAALAGWNAETMTDDERAEASARFEFTHALLNRLMTREAEIRDAYYKARRNGMAARTLALSAAIVAAAAMAIWCPLWVTAPAALLAGVWIGTRAKTLSRKLDRVRPPVDVAPLIASVLPWRIDGVAKTA